MIYEGFHLLVLPEILLFVYFLYISIYNSVLSIAGHFWRDIKIKPHQSFSNILVLIPAYKEDNVILHSIDKNQDQNYPKKFYELIVIADSMNEETIEKLGTKRCTTFQVNFQHSTKVKAINSALNGLNITPDIMVVLDADNIMDPDFLKNVNAMFQEGSKLVQGRRCADDGNNQLSHLDDLSEQINNHINRKGACALGGSSSIAGSGFAVDYKLGASIFSKLDSVGGFDKEFEVYALTEQVKTTYSENLTLIDQKIDSQRSFHNQRRRWISSQYVFLGKYFNYAWKSFLKGNLSAFNSIFLRNLQLPRLLNLGVFTVLLMAILIWRDFFRIDLIYWLMAYLVYVMSVFIAIPRRYYSWETFQSLKNLPILFFNMFSLLFRLRKANQTFIHTPHKAITPDERS